ncbi:primosome assembly protein PriA [Streptomyces sp. NPDC093707]|uniref:primosome assembly protein PriA n=1 Tax=Streptomyces sp. NPDC093707 TaxID=3154984 RepID=UPI00344CED78
MARREQGLSETLRALCRAVADRYAGSLDDVLRLAAPSREVGTEEPFPAPPPSPAAPTPATWGRYPNGLAFLEALARGDCPRAVWTALPGPHWPCELAAAVTATLASGRGALVVLPDSRSVARVDAALGTLVGAGRHVVLTADCGPEERDRRWQAVSRGSVRAVIGTRTAMFASVADLGLVAIWDDGNASHSEDRAPYPHAREVLLLRAVHETTACLVGDVGQTAEAAQLLATGWARPLAADRATVRAAAPLVRTVDDADQGLDAAARLPTQAWRTARTALERGPVLVQVPRRGYVPRLACKQCRAPARCRHCSGPLEARRARDALCCGWCGKTAPDWACAECGCPRLWARAVGTRRTAEELGRAFSGVPVRTSSRDHIVASIPDRPALVVSTPGAEPFVEGGGGYAAALLLDGWALLGRPDLRAGEMALRRWLGAAALVRDRAAGGTVMVIADPAARPVQALVRWDPSGFAQHELAERAELGFPPVSRMATVEGPGHDVMSFLWDTVQLPPSAVVLGLVPLPAADPDRPGGAGEPASGEEWMRALVRVPRGQGAALAAALKAARTAGQGQQVRVRIDPLELA